MILVTGGTGFIGQRLVRNLVRKGRKVRVLARDREKAGKVLPRKAEVVEGDISKPGTLGPALRGVKEVVHLAGMVSYSRPRKELLRINLEGTLNLLEACRKAGVKRFIFSGSVGAMGPIRGTADENYPCRPSTPYGESKLKAEMAVLDSGIPSVVLRLAPVYGKGSPSWKKNLKMLEKGFPIPEVKGLTHVLSVGNAVQAFERALDKGSGVYLIADREPVYFREFASGLVRMLGKEPKYSSPWMASFMATLAGKMQYLRVLTMNRHYNTLKARKELGYKPAGDFRKGLKEMVDWYKSLKGGS